MADRKLGAPTPPTDTLVSGADWSGQEISRQTHTRVAFVDVDMTETTNDGSVFTECTFRNVRFNVSIHRNSAFLNCTFAGCTFFDARFTDCKLVGSMFDKCSYDLLKVTGGDWSFVGLPGADLRKASFSGTRMREADLTAVRAQGASLRDVDLSGASLHNAKLSRADLRGSDVSAIVPSGVELKGAIITIDQALVIATALGLDIRAE